MLIAFLDMRIAGIYFPGYQNSCPRRCDHLTIDVPAPGIIDIPRKSYITRNVVGNQPVSAKCYIDYLSVQYLHIISSDVPCLSRPCRKTMLQRNVIGVILNGVVCYTLQPHHQVGLLFDYA